MKLHARLRRALLAAAALPACAAAPALSSPAAPVEAFAVSSEAIGQFGIGRADETFGPLEFVGGLEMTSAGRNFGGLSAFRFLTPGADFVGVADTGFWVFGRIAHDAAGGPSGVEAFRMQKMVDAAGRPFDAKRQADAEGLAVRDGIVTVGFERRHRVSQFRLDPADMKGPFRDLDFLVPARELRQNRGFETIVHAPRDGALQGALVAVSERSLDAAGNVYAAVLDGPRKGVFTVKREGDFDITDGAFLPDGDLLILERSFSFLAGVGMRLRRLSGDSVGTGRLADGPVLMQADMSHRIDNMEGLDVWRRGDGALMVSLISDDNQSFLQRTLYLEFILHEDGRQAAQ